MTAPRSALSESNPAAELLGPSGREPALVRDAEQRAATALRDAELELDLARARLMSRYGAPIWAGFALYDVLQASRPGVGHLPELLFLRALGTLLLAALALWGQRSAPSRWRIDIGTTVAGMALNLCLSFMSLYDGGFTSMYSPGVLLVMFAIGSVPRPFRRGLRINLCVILPYPLVLCVAAACSPQHAALLRDRSVVTAAVQFHFALLATVCFVAFIGQVVWSMRRQLLATQTLGRYQLARALGRGPLGEVCVAYHHGLRREVAVKVLRSVDASTAQHFEQLVAGLSGLTHPNTVRLYDFGLSQEGRPYYAMELLYGETLRALIAREGRLEVARATRIVLQIARSLAEAHGRGIVHRNLKPENVFLTAGGGEPDFVRVVDYGFAALGAPREDATPEADVYALGAIYFWLLTGEPVLKDELPGAERAPSPSAHLSQPLPDRIESVVVRCLESDPSERFANARELAHALKNCLLMLERPLEAVPGHAELSRAQRLRAQPESASDETRIEDPDELERRMGASGDDTESMASR